jgi:hypothetical protein
MDLVEASYVTKDYELYDKILVLMRYGEAKHNVFEREYARTNVVPGEEANEDQDYPADPSLTGKVGCEFYMHMHASCFLSCMKMF